MMNMNLTMVRYLHAKGARLSQGKPNPRVRACVVLVGLQLISTEIVLNVPLQKHVIVAVVSPSQSSDAVSDVL